MNTDMIPEAQQEETKPTTTETPPERKTISLTLPKISLPSLQSGVLILLIIVGGLQTAQLFALNRKITSARVNVGGASTAPTSTTTPPTSSLPNMVGGC